MTPSRPFLIAVLAAVLLGPRPEARAADLPPLRPESRPGFSADVVASVDAEGGASVTVTIAVPRDQLQWVKGSAGFSATAEFAVVFHPEKRGRDHGDLWERRWTVSEFSATGRSGAPLLERRTFELPAGRYQVRVTLEDVQARVRGTAAGHLVVADLSNTRFGFTDLELGHRPDGAAFEPVPSRRYGFDVARLAARATIFDRRPGPWPRTCRLIQRIRDDLGNLVREERSEIRLSAAVEPVVFQPDTVDLFLGSYVFEIEVQGDPDRASGRRSFEVEESRPPRGREFQRLAGPLSYVALPEEAEALRDPSPEERDRAWERFWKRRDPTPDSPPNEALLEFMSRVQYAERHFRELGFGWDSDRGRIHIKYGVPGSVETREASSSHGPLIIWTYERPRRRFVFEDRTGFGRYQLVEGAE